MGDEKLPCPARNVQVRGKWPAPLTRAPGEYLEHLPAHFKGPSNNGLIVYFQSVGRTWRAPYNHLAKGMKLI